MRLQGAERWQQQSLGGSSEEHGSNMQLRLIGNEKKETFSRHAKRSTVCQEAIRKGLERNQDWRKEHALPTKTSNRHRRILQKFLNM